MKKYGRFQYAFVFSKDIPDISVPPPPPPPPPLYPSPPCIILRYSLCFGLSRAASSFLEPTELGEVAEQLPFGINV